MPVRLGIIRWLLPMALAISAGSCKQPGPVTLYGPARPLTAADFMDVRQRWTRSAKLYSGIENKLFINATYHSPEFRRAFAAAFPDIYGHGGAITRRELVDLTGDVEQYHTFFVTAYTPNPRWNDLAQQDSIWRLSLVGPNNVSVGPRDVVPVKMDENLRAVYGHYDRFHKAYLVRFPLADALRSIIIHPESEHFEMRVASALGVATMRWDLIPVK